MNKQELTRRIENQKEIILKDYGWAVYNYIRTLVGQLDEPQKVTVPQFMADWIEYFKKIFRHIIWKHRTLLILWTGYN